MEKIRSFQDGFRKKFVFAVFFVLIFFFLLRQIVFYFGIKRQEFVPEVKIYRGCLYGKS